MSRMILIQAVLLLLFLITERKLNSSTLEAFVIQGTIPIIQTLKYNK